MAHKIDQAQSYDVIKKNIKTCDIVFSQSKKRAGWSLKKKDTLKCDFKIKSTWSPTDNLKSQIELGGGGVPALIVFVEDWLSLTLVVFGLSQFQVQFELLQIGLELALFFKS